MHRRTFVSLPAAAAVSVAATASERPGLYYTRARAAEIRKRLVAEPELRRKWATMIEQADGLLAARLIPENIAEQGGGQHANYGRPSGQISDMGLTLGLAYHVSGEKKYADKLREALLYYAGYKRWGGQGLAERVPPWHSELNTARFCFGFGAGYDALLTELSKEDRKTIGSAMVSLGILPTLEDWILPETRIHALDSMGHNWWSVCVAMAGVAALALRGDDDRVGGWLARIETGFDEWFDYGGNTLQNKPASFDPEGGFYEGVGYTNYGVSEYLRFRLAYGNVFPARRQPHYDALEKLVPFFIHSMYPASASFKTVNFGDSSLRANAAHTVRLLLETGFDHPAAGWYLKRVPPRADAFEVLARKAPAPAGAAPRVPESVLYPGMGWGLLRTSWEDDATLLGVRSGFTWNHTHADGGSFVLFHNGEPLITDSGAVNYSNPLYGGYYVQSRAHNVVLFNGQGQGREDIRRGGKFPGELHSLLDGSGLKYIYADATGPMARYFTRNYRHWLWVGGVILIFDDIRSHEDGRLDWLLHYDGAAEVNGSRFTLISRAACADVHVLFPQKFKVSEQAGYADHQPDVVKPYLSLSAPTVTCEGKFIIAVLPYAPGQKPAASVAPLSGENAIGVRVTENGDATDVYLNLQSDGRRMHVNTNNVIAGWDTDAYLFAVTRPHLRYFVSAASYMRNAEGVALDSLSKVDAIWCPGDRMEVQVAGQQRIDVRLATREKPSGLRVNGRSLPILFDEGLVRVRLSSHGSKGVL